MPVGPAVSDCEELWNKALEGNGVVVEFKSSAARTKMRQRLYTARDRDRKNSQKIYPDPDDARHGRSAWDDLVLVLVGDTKMRISKPRLDEATSGILRIIEMGD